MIVRRPVRIRRRRFGVKTTLFGRQQVYLIAKVAKLVRTILIIYKRKRKGPLKSEV